MTSTTRVKSAGRTQQAPAGGARVHTAAAGACRGACVVRRSHCCGGGGLSVCTRACDDAVRLMSQRAKRRRVGSKTKATAAASSKTCGEDAAVGEHRAFTAPRTRIPAATADASSKRRCPLAAVLSHRGGLCTRLEGHSLWPHTPQGQPSLYERVGGRSCLRATLRSLYTRLHADPAIQQMFIRNFDKEVHAQTCFWTEMLGGPKDWTNAPNDCTEKYGVHAVNYTSMLNRHSPTLLITPEHAECWLAHLRDAAVECITDSEAAEAMIAHATPLARALINQPTGACAAKLFDCHRSAEYKDGAKLAGAH